MAEPLNKPWTRYCGCRDMQENLGYCVNCGYKIQPEPTSPSVEDQVRFALWSRHGHDGKYGDDGEMQCGQCRVWDYKRAPLMDLIDAVIQINDRSVADAERLAKENRELKEQLQELNLKTGYYRRKANRRIL